MSGRSKLENQMPGHVATSTMPGHAVPRRLRRIARATSGVTSLQQEAQRLFVTREPKARPTPHVVDVFDVTKNLGLEKTDVQRIHNFLHEYPATFDPSPSARMTREYRLPQVQGALISLLRSIDMDSAVRQEIQRRAMALWQKKASEMSRAPKLRISKAQAASRTLLKGKPSEDERKKDPNESKDSKKQAALRPDTKAKGDEKKLAEPKADKADVKGKDEEEEDRPTLKNVGSEDYEEPGDEDEENPTKKGKRIKFHENVHADLPEDADFHHHITEHAAHLAQYRAKKETNPEEAEAHRHAANLHARVGNALHAAGETAKDHGKQEMPPGFGEDGPPGAEDAENELDPDDDKKGPQKGSGAAGVDVMGKPHPDKPDTKRNEPGKDDYHQSKEKQKMLMKKALPNIDYMW